MEKRKPRVLFFGMQSNFSAPVLTALLNDAIEVVAVVVPVTPIVEKHGAALRKLEPPRTVRTPLPLLQTSASPAIVSIAQARQIPVWEVRDLSDSETIATLAAYQPDVLCVACFSQRIPGAIMGLPRYGCVNVHPSLLPANRGPVPLFWTFRAGDNLAGITIHMLDERLDSGDILAQKTIEVPDGMRYHELENLCATLGGALLARTIHDLYKGQAVRITQNEEKSSYHSFPTDEDFVVYADQWTARHVYNFIRGVGNWGGPITLYAGDTYRHVRDAISYRHNAIDEHKTDLWHVGNEGIEVGCRDGWVCVKE